ncbi:NAD(P)/FAD-dependent oxidoreductase [Leucobacter sp. wl10]|uniref:protoporphyrinogen/coproporphyrinogen oxidase n=1 Tax=Leucobacter sp. wl10 TaxID=2304677 RepID=UPI000E5AE35E|nr:FAD-dependent oxidoreductase [Leucobacter sp. wl10]RGE19365.1 FAD-dependent oxidoreductase [Leucobacter sp. wl10]
MRADPADHRDGTVAVIGGGVSGLVAARDLARAGARVVLVEEGDRLGGRVRGETVDGVAVDIGAEAFATRGGAVAALLAELGLADEIVRPAPLGSWVVTGTGAVPLPAAGAIGIPAAPLSRDAVRALGPVGALRAAAEPMLPRHLGRGGSLAELVRARLGPRVLARLVRPVVLGVHSADPSDMTVADVPGLAAALERSGSLLAAGRELRDSRAAAGGAVAGLRGGMGALVAALAAELDRAGVVVRTGVAAGRLEAERDGRGRRVWAVTGARGEPLVRADAVILAVSEAAARRLLGAPPAAPSGRVEVVALVVDDPRLDSAPRGTGALVAESASGIAAKALTHATAKWPDRARLFGPGRHLIRLSYGRLGSAPATGGLGDEAALRLAVRDASRILGIELGEASVRHMIRREWEAGNARQGDPAAGDALEAPPGVVFAGDWVSGTGLASVIPGARAAAEEAARTTIDSDGATVPHREGAQQR